MVNQMSENLRPIKEGIEEMLRIARRIYLIYNRVWTSQIDYSTEDSINDTVFDSITPLINELYEIVEDLGYGFG